MKSFIYLLSVWKRHVWVLGFHRELHVVDRQFPVFIHHARFSVIRRSLLGHEGFFCRKTNISRFPATRDVIAMRSVSILQMISWHGFAQPMRACIFVLVVRRRFLSVTFIILGGDCQIRKIASISVYSFLKICFQTDSCRFEALKMIYSFDSVRLVSLVESSMSV